MDLVLSPLCAAACGDSRGSQTGPFEALGPLRAAKGKREVEECAWDLNAGRDTVGVRLAGGGVWNRDRAWW